MRARRRRHCLVAAPIGFILALLAALVRGTRATLTLGGRDDPQTQLLVSRAKAADEKTVYYLTTDHNYVDVAVNNLAVLHRLGIRGYAVGCVDVESVEMLAARGFDCAYLDEAYFEYLGRLHVEDLTQRASWRESFIKIVRLKFRGIMMILEAGYDALFLDADAVLLQRPELVHAGTADIIASTGSFPRKITKPWGAAICTGFFFAHAIPAAQEVMDRSLREAVRVFDDQIGMNLALLEIGVHWEHGNISFIPEETAPLCKGRAEMEEGELRVAMLNPRHYVRFCEEYPREEATMLHCRSHHADAVRKEDVMREQRTWVLRSDWADDSYRIAAAGSWERFLELVTDPELNPG